MSLKKVCLPIEYNYIAAFLTLECNFNCNYCINFFSRKGRFIKRKTLSTQNWISILNRLESREDLPVTLQGGEPSLHPGFIKIINGLKSDLKIDILTNLSFSVDEFIDKINPLRLKRCAPYPSIRISFHPLNMDLNEVIVKSLKLQNSGFSLGIYAIEYPWLEPKIAEARKRCKDAGLIFKTKDFLGEYNGKIFGTYSDSKAIGNKNKAKRICRTSELIIGPGGDIFRCHHDLYKNFKPIASLSDPGFKIKYIFRDCNEFGDCNPCDLKIKTNRFQICGHSSVEIKTIKW